MSRYEPTILLLWSMLTAALVFGDISGPLRTVVALGFLASVPGLAVTRLFGANDVEFRALTAIPISLAIEAVVSGALVYAGLPSWDLGMSIVLSLTIGVVIIGLVRPTLELRPTPDSRIPGKLGDGARQARLVDALLDGGSLAEAAGAAGVSPSTLYRTLRRSEVLRRAVDVASEGRVDLEPYSAAQGEISRDRP